MEAFVRSFYFLTLAAGLGLASCDGAETPAEPGSGGSLPGSGGTAAGGSAGVGGTTPLTGGSSAGGRATGGTATGGTATGGRATGGSATGGRASGGSSTGGNASGGQAAGGSGGAYNPCPGPGTACIIMPLGDSITDGVGSPSPGGGYRVPLFQTTVNGAELITFVGRNANGPTTVAGKTFPRNHEGYSGYTIDPGGGRQGISPLVDAALSQFHPHIVLLMIGTNDVNISLDLANAPTRLGALFDRITSDAPNALLVVAKLVPTTNDTTNGRVRTYNDAIPGLVQTRAAAGKHIVMVDMYTAFTSNASYKTALMSDELHPNNAGYSVMAQTWYAAIGAYLPGN
jgi:lysophospholipase L1-like esterase